MKKIKRKRTNYERGVEVERRIIKELKEAGYIAICRSAGSHSFYDIYAVSPKNTLLIQSKRCKVFNDSSYEGDIQEIKEASKNLHSKTQVEFWVWLDNTGFIKKEVIKKAK